jgi:class 3 adenylate cyclase
MDQRFEELLLQYAKAEEPVKRQEIEDTLWEEFGHKKAILIMDMSGFSLLTQKYGIVHYLSMVKRMQITSQPIIERNGGTVVKFEADNCFAMFDDVLPALQGAVALNTAFDAINEYTHEPFDIRVSIGIDYGDVLLIGGPDYFGDTVNRASKLGEDVAGPGEIYIAEGAFQQVPVSAGYTGKPIKLSLSGIRLNAIKLNFR